MLEKESKIEVKESGKKVHLSKQTILEIVRAVERGATRREVTTRYGVSKSAVSAWMREYCSPSYLSRIKQLSRTDTRSLCPTHKTWRINLFAAKTTYPL